MNVRLIKRPIGFDLAVTPDSGNTRHIPMGQTKEAQDQNWSILRDISSRAIAHLDHPSLLNVPEDESLPLGRSDNL